MLKLFFALFFDFEAAMLQIYSKVNQYQLKKKTNFPACTIIIDNFLPVTSFVLHYKYKPVESSDKLKPLLNVPLNHLTCPRTSRKNF